jgi:hypothetical protein
MLGKYVKTILCLTRNKIGKGYFYKANVRLKFIAQVGTLFFYYFN